MWNEIFSLLNLLFLCVMSGWISSSLNFILCHANNFPSAGQETNRTPSFQMSNYPLFAQTNIAQNLRNDAKIGAKIFNLYFETGSVSLSVFLCPGDIQLTLVNTLQQFKRCPSGQSLNWRSNFEDFAGFLVNSEVLYPRNLPASFSKHIKTPDLNEWGVSPSFPYVQVYTGYLNINSHNNQQ